MTDLTIAQRRQIVARARNDPGFLNALRRDGHAAVAEETHVRLPADMMVHVLLEIDDTQPIGVVPRPEALVEGLPEPNSFRDVWENLLLATIMADDSARAEFIADPLEFTAALTGNFRADRFDVYVEKADETYLVIYTSPESDEIFDADLDFVTGGGGNPACAEAKSGSSRTQDGQ